MTIERVKNTIYDLQTFVGDSGVVNITNIPTDKNTYVIYMEVHGKTEIKKSITLNGADTCQFEFSVFDTKALGVGNWEYGIKICDSSESPVVENTYIPDLRVSNKATFFVYPERVEGVINES